ncbi:MAG: HAD-IA family hydrolase [Clostridiales Family XIII bacterium]|jgi:pyrophosphatase PpaX|nr:HAD-IA family hydrolase [Clostridiales Family XIII bacterium]
MSPDKLPQNIDTALFDFDGTIMNTNDVILASWRHAFKELLGAEPDEKAVLDTFGEPIDDCVSKLFPDSDPEEVKRVYRDYQFAHYEEKIHLFPGIYELMETLHNAGIRTGVVTNRLRNSTVRGLELFGLDAFIDIVVAFDDAEEENLNAKPEPDAVLYAVEKLGSRPERSLLVGDTLNDIISGNRAGVTTVRVAWAIAEDGAHDTEADEAAPDFLIHKSSELLDIIGMTRKGDGNFKKE